MEGKANKKELGVIGTGNHVDDQGEVMTRKKTRKSAHKNLPTTQENPENTLGPRRANAIPKKSDAKT